jgi:hypothetical protein
LGLEHCPARATVVILFEIFGRGLEPVSQTKGGCVEVDCYLLKGEGKDWTDATLRIPLSILIIALAAKTSLDVVRELSPLSLPYQAQVPLSPRMHSRSAEGEIVILIQYIISAKT